MCLYLPSLRNLFVIGKGNLICYIDGKGTCLEISALFAVILKIWEYCLKASHYLLLYLFLIIVWQSFLIILFSLMKIYVHAYM